MKYQCRMPDRDGEAWTQVEAVDASTAAMDYAESCDVASGRHIFDDGATHVIVVKDENDGLHTFTSSVDLSPTGKIVQFKTAIGETGTPSRIVVVQDGMEDSPAERSRP